MSPDPERRPQLFLIFGGPGAGKGTQASLLSQSLGVPHISSGELLREHQRHDTEGVMSSGELLPDDLVTRVVRARPRRLARPAWWRRARRVLPRRAAGGPRGAHRWSRRKQSPR